MNNNKRVIILHFITGLKIGGAECALYNFLSHAPKAPYTHCVIYFHDGPIVEKIKSLGIYTQQIKGIINTYDPAALFRIFKIIKKLKPALIIGRLMSYYFKIPIICDLHGDCLHEGKFRNLLDKLTAPLATHTIAVAPSIQENYLCAISLNAHIETICNGIDIEEVHAKAKVSPITRNKINATQKDFILGAIGRLEPIKSYDILIKAIALALTISKDIKLKLCLVGDGSQKESLIKLSNNLGISERIFFAGQQNNPSKFYPLFNCFVISSQSEGLSLALLEALAFCLPIITTHNKPTHDVLVNNINGLLVPPNKPTTLANAIVALAKNSELISLMSKENKKLILNYSIHNVIEKYYKLYNTYIK
jgi:glycosyltransferase involved in cell wall biosynthesis